MKNEMMKKRFFFCTIGLLFITGCTSDATSGNPREVLIKFFTALSQRDIQEARKYVTADSEGMINMMQMSIKNMDAPQEGDQFNPEKLEIAEPQIDGEVAKVPVTDKQTKETVNFTMKKEKGDWKVAFDMKTLINMAREKMETGGQDHENLDSFMQKLSEESSDKVKEAQEYLKKHPDMKEQKLKEMMDEIKIGPKKDSQ